VTTFTPVQGDPFAAPPPPAAPGGPKLTPVEGDPFAKPAAPSGFAMGMGDPGVGVAQGASHLGMVPLPEYDQFSPAAVAFGHPAAADTASVTSGDIDKYVAAREQSYQAARQLAGATGIDWGRIAGNIVNPAVLGAAALPGGGEAGLIGTALRSAFGGGASALTQPVDKPGDYPWQKIKQALTGAGYGAVLGPAASAAGRGVTAAARAGWDKLLATPLENAARSVERRLASNPTGATIEQVLDELAKARQLGVPKVAADVSQELGDLGGKVFRAPGGESRAVARDVLEGRQLGNDVFQSAKERLSRAIDTIWSGASAYRTEQALTAAQKAAAQPLYQQAEALNFIWSERLQQYLNQPEVRQGLNEGLKMERLEALDERRPFDPTQLGLELDLDGNVKLIKTLNLRVLDMAKRGLDSMIAGQREATGKLSPWGRRLAGTKSKFVEEIDYLDTSGIYRRARDAWAGPAATKDALEIGKNLFSQSPEEIRDMMANMGDAEREAVKIGTADMLRERILKAGFGGDQARAILRTPWMEQHLEQLIPKAADREKFFYRVAGEHTMAETAAKRMAGSQSAERLAEDLSPEMRNVIRAVNGARGLARLTHGDVWGGIRDIGSAVADMVHGSTNPEVMNILAGFLFSPDVNRGDALAQRLLRGPQTVVPDALTRALNRIPVAIGSGLGGVTSSGR
jgi:hypothetical protein